MADFCLKNITKTSYRWRISSSEEKGEVTQSCPTLCDPTDCSPPTVAHRAPLSMRILQARILEWVAMPFSRGIFPTQGSNPGLLHCRQILYRLRHQGSPRNKNDDGKTQDPIGLGEALCDTLTMCPESGQRYPKPYFSIFSMSITCSF